ncbi:axonemal dynein light intermediate polypeptide 1 isoform X3 [Tachyglossus aculeatus]|uniref:axonemal dynein light intermediate polypeptide 1 isoform X1 n=1 Tax=Tachyglossus aculeatus TaxID=9261 RepID=UPI0018F2EE2D|nr:axonemal dynein light intermediate polypeptide 1 isoform X1 [Tachyglossus aculeatus]XP_038613824.1 axonemal dynein light intermediate polypeptide 1 isoform X2 [Tachyglossus aculeatus]XP_038613825.1 axonemal dynein light intermediate polypeptide 1 isoform X3 [Tachyglossus aculeatus]
MIPPADSLLKYDTPVLVSRNTEKRSTKARPLKGSPQQPVAAGPVPAPPKPKSPSASVDPTKQAEEILNSILPPREWVEDTQLWIQQVSSTPSTRMDVVHLQEQLDLKLQQRQARETGICPVRRDLYSQCFDELIREITINCAERGLLLLRVRDEIRMTIAAYQTLYESSVAFGMRKALQAEQGKADMEKKIADLESEKKDLERQVNEQKAKCEATEKRESERRLAEERKHAEEIQFLKRTNQQLKAQLEGIIAPKK